jgi:hypothetical protein
MVTGELLGILFAEVSPVCLDDVQELGNNGRDTAEVAWAELAFKTGTQAADFDRSEQLVRIHFACPRGEGCVHTQ